jgi:hypothetical protein
MRLAFLEDVIKFIFHVQHELLDRPAQAQQAHEADRGESGCRHREFKTGAITMVI